MPSAKKSPALLPHVWRQGSIGLQPQGRKIMARARTKIRARARTAQVKRGARPASRKRIAAAPSRAKARRKHKFLVKRYRPQDFKSDGLRAYAQYRDLGIKDATYGMAVAHVIRLKGPCDPKVVSKLHLHEADFQMIYVLNGSITGYFEGAGVHTMKTGDAWLQPQGIEHKVLDYSDDCELLEIVLPGNFETVELEA
jgi:hypothetical protein